jgi:protein-disulfide isomerase
MAEERKRPRGEGGEAGAQASGEGMQPHVYWAVVSAVVLVLLAPALFVAGFFTNELVSDDDGETAVVAQPTPSGATPVPATPTAPPVVPATADDDAFTGPADATVTLIEFSDYQ